MVLPGEEDKFGLALDILHISFGYGSVSVLVGSVRTLGVQV